MNLNLNLIRTFIAIFTSLLGAATYFFGCNADGTVCTAPWLTPSMMALVVMILGAAHLVLKAIGGLGFLISPTAPVDTPKV